jgi:hypothetical protein
MFPLIIDLAKELRSSARCPPLCPRHLHPGFFVLQLDADDPGPGHALERPRLAPLPGPLSGVELSRLVSPPDLVSRVLEGEECFLIAGFQCLRLRSEKGLDAPCRPGEVSERQHNCYHGEKHDQ